MKPNPLPFLREKWVGVAQPEASFAGKSVLVTGSNTGIGFEAAATFAALDAELVILAVRNISKGTEARQKIEARTSHSCNIEVWELDMGSYASIQKFASRVEKELPRLDVAVLNAGISPNDYVVGAEGWESILQINVLGTALLGLLLLPKLKASKVSREDTPHLIIVTSEAQRWLEAKDFPDPAQHGGNLLLAVNARPEDVKQWNPLLQYARSKLFAMYISRSLAALVTPSNGELETIVIAVCPGGCKSELARDLLGQNVTQTIALKLFDTLFNKPTQQGGWTYVWAASLGAEANGGWYKTTTLTE